MRTRLSDGVIMRPWSEYKGYHHIKDPWTLSKVIGGEVKNSTHNMDLSQKREALIL